MLQAGRPDPRALAWFIGRDRSLAAHGQIFRRPEAEGAPCLNSWAKAMPDLSFTIDSAEAVPFAAAPMIAFKLRIANADPEEIIHTVVLRCQIQLEVARRRYTPSEQEQMLDLFGGPERWSQTLRSMLWTHASVVAPSFAGSTYIDLHIPCTFDFNIAATKYFHGL